MPTTFTGGDLKVAASQSIVNISETLLATQAFSTKVETSGLGEGDTTQVFVVGEVPDAENFDREGNNYMTDNGGAHAWKDIKLSQHKKLTFRIKPQIFDKLSTTDLANLYKPHVSKLCDAVIKSAFEEITAANFSNFLDIPDLSKFDKNAASQVETALAKLVGNGGERNLVLSMDGFSYLRESLTGIYVSPTSDNALIQGSIQGIVGFQNVIRTTALKSVGVEKKKYLVGIATNKSGLAMAFAHVPVTSRFDGDWEVVNDSVTGIPITFSVDYDKDNRDYVATVEVLFGVGIADKKGILRLITEVK